jgi:oligoribonuclease NrnB/cAMP/cGMP phosphodiesterase (DHH superfamily)
MASDTGSGATPARLPRQGNAHQDGGATPARLPRQGNAHQDGGATPARLPRQGNAHQDGGATSARVKIAAVYHQLSEDTSCHDGIASAWVVRRYYPDAIAVPCTYDRRQAFCATLPDDIDKLYAVDFSFTPDQLDLLASKVNVLLVIDHHKSAFKEIGDRADCFFDLEESGATACWNYFFVGQEKPPILKFIKDRDLFEFKYPETKWIHEALRALGLNFALLDRLAEMTEQELFWFLQPVGKRAVEENARIVRQYVENEVQWVKIDRFSIPAVRTGKGRDYLASDICRALYKKYTGSPFVACYNAEGKWELRSDKNGSNWDVSEIALRFGGGGHRNAAGFYLSTDSTLKELAAAFDAKKN